MIRLLSPSFDFCEFPDELEGCGALAASSSFTICFIGPPIFSVFSRTCCCSEMGGFSGAFGGASVFCKLYFAEVGVGSGAEALYCAYCAY